MADFMRCSTSANTSTAMIPFPSHDVYRFSPLYTLWRSRCALARSASATRMSQTTARHTAHHVSGLGPDRIALVGQFVHQRAASLATRHGQNLSWRLQIEDDDGQMIVVTQ